MRNIEKVVAVAALALALVTGGAWAGARGPASTMPWYPSLQAFEHYDSGRSHVFPKARFGGSFKRPNRVVTVSSATGAYPSGYNTSYLNADAMFIQGGSYGNYTNSIGPFVARVNPSTLQTIWYTQLVDTVETACFG